MRENILKNITILFFLINKKVPFQFYLPFQLNLGQVSANSALVLTWDAGTCCPKFCRSERKYYVWKPAILNNTICYAKIRLSKWWVFVHKFTVLMGEFLCKLHGSFIPYTFSKLFKDVSFSSSFNLHIV